MRAIVVVEDYDAGDEETVVGILRERGCARAQFLGVDGGNGRFLLEHADPSALDVALSRRYEGLRVSDIDREGGQA